MDPSEEDVKEMRRLMNIMNNIDLDDIVPPQQTVRTYDDSYVAPPATSAVPDDEAKEIRKLLLAMEGLVPDAVEESRTNPILNEALITEKINDHTVQVGSWKVEKVLMESYGKTDNFYKISNTVTKQSLEPVLVYESAQALLKILNQGHNLQDKEINAILELDEDYCRLRSKALEEKAIWQRAKNNNLEWKQQLYESKFNSSQYQALYIKERIKNFLLK